MLNNLRGYIKGAMLLIGKKNKRAPNIRTKLKNYQKKEKNIRLYDLRETSK